MHYEKVCAPVFNDLHEQYAEEWGFFSRPVGGTIRRTDEFASIRGPFFEKTIEEKPLFLFSLIPCACTANL